MKKSLQYRAEVVSFVVLSVVPTFVVLFIWTAVYGHTPSVHGYTLPALLQYFLIATLIANIATCHFESERTQEVREGKIDHFLTKPLSYPMHIFTADIGEKIFRVMFSLFFFTVFYIGLTRFFPLNHFDVTFLQVLEFTGLMIFSYSAEFALALITVLATFWFEGAEGLQHFKWIATTVLTGYMIPIAFMPGWIQKGILFLPFHYMYAMPIAVLQHSQIITIIDICSMALFLFFLYLIAFILWKKAIVKYTSAA